jgi:hypothetical protein
MRLFMAWLFLVAAILSMLFPPVGVVVLAMVVMGVFTKGVVADSPDPVVAVRRKAGHRGGAERARDETGQPDKDPRQGNVIDVRCYPILFPPRLPAPLPQSLDGPR